MKNDNKRYFYHHFYRSKCLKLSIKQLKMINLLSETVNLLSETINIVTTQVVKLLFLLFWEIKASVIICEFPQIPGNGSCQVCW